MVNLKQLYEPVQKLYEQFKPKHWYSWQTAIWLSAISGILSTLARLVSMRSFSLVATLIATLGWFFLITGISWAVTEQGNRFAPWITGAVLCFFVFGGYTTVNWGQVVVIWPLVSAIVFMLPYFWDESLQQKLPSLNDRITIMLVVGSQLILSFWIQFFIVLSTFLQEYPSFYSDNLSNSLFIVRTPAGQTQEPRGVFLLNLLDIELVDYYQNRPWKTVEAELLTNPTVPVNDLFNAVKGRTPTLKEDQYWSLLDPSFLPKDPGYELTLQYEWRGAKAQLDQDYYVQKVCLLTPYSDPADPSRELFTAIACQPSQVNGWLMGKLD